MTSIENLKTPPQTYTISEFPAENLTTTHFSASELKNSFVIQINDEEDQALATILTASAENSYFQEFSKLAKNALNNCLYLGPIWLKNNEAQPLLSLLLYFALRRGRIWGKEQVVSLSPLESLHLMPLPQISAYAQSLKYSIYKIYESCDEVFKTIIHAHYSKEISEVINRWLNRFYYQGSWAQSILNGVLTKEQYITSLYNLHEYVRYTTRIAARAIAYAENPILRNHFIYHMRGEINHELMIERDLAYLGADLPYLLNAHVPSKETKAFMMTQESTIGFYQDPLLLLACPLAAEGMAAHIKPDFIDALLNLIQSWGYNEPKKAASFLISHINTDGGDDGHWQAVVNTLQQFLNNEILQQRFLSTLICAMEGFESGFNANVDNLQIWNQH